MINEIQKLLEVYAPYQNKDKDKLASFFIEEALETNEAIVHFKNWATNVNIKESLGAACAGKTDKMHTCFSVLRVVEFVIDGFSDKKFIAESLADKFSILTGRKDVKYEEATSLALNRLYRIREHKAVDYNLVDFPFYGLVDFAERELDIKDSESFALECFKRVCEANVRKLYPDLAPDAPLDLSKEPNPIYNEFGKMQKPQQWQAPVFQDIIKKYINNDK